MERAGNGASGKRCDIDGVTRTGELAGVSESSRRVDGKAKWLRERGRTNQARRVSDFTRSRNDSRGPNILTAGKCPATLPRSRLSENRPSRPKDQQIFRERERCNQPRSHAALLRQFPGRCEAARRGRFA